MARLKGAKVQESRGRIVSAAAQLLREKGFDGIGVDDLMQAAGMTHGGFYRHFTSKEELIVEACQHAFTQTRDSLTNALDAGPGDPLEALIARYVSADHRDRPGAGCSLTTLATDAARRDNPALRAVFTDAIRIYLDAIAALAPAASSDASRQAAVATLAEMVGGVVLARVIADRPLADEMIDRVRDDLAGRFRLRKVHAGPSPDPDQPAELDPSRSSPKRKH